MWGPRCVVSVEEGGGRDEAGALILTQYGVPGAWSQPEEGDEAGALFLNQYVPGACSEAGALILNQYGVPGACSRGPGRRNMGFQARGLSPKKAEAGTRPELGSQAGTRPERLSSTNVESQVRDLGPKKVKVGCLKPEEGELQEEATTSSKDLLSEYVLGAWSQPEEDRGGDKVRGLNLKRMEAGTRPEHFSSTNIGSEVRGLNSNRKLKLKKTEVWKFKLKKTQAWKLKLKKGKDKVRILKKKKAGSGNEAVQARLHGVPGAWSQSKKAEAGTRPAQYGGPGAWSQPEEGGGGDEAGAGVPGAKAEAGTRPERLSSTNVESQVRDLGPKKVKVGCLKPEEGELQEEATTGSKDLLSEYVLGAWSQPEEDGGGDKAGSPILNCHGFPGSWSGENRSRDQAGVPILKQYGVPGARSQLEEDGGGNQAGALVLNQYRVRGAWSQLEQDGGEERPEYLCKDKAGRAHPQPTWGSEVRKFKLKKTQVWKFKLKKTEAWKLQAEEGQGQGVEAQAEGDGGKDKAWKLKLKKGKNKAWKLKLKETEAWKLKLKKGKNKVWKLKPKKTEARTRPGVKLKRKKTEAWTLKRKKTEARRRPGVDAQAEEDGGKDQAWKLKRKKTEARTRRTLKETESPKASHGECKEYARYLGIDPGYEGEETHNAMLCPSLGEDEAGALTLNQYGVPGVTSRSPKKLEAGTTGSQSGEGEGGEEVRGLNLKKAEGTRPEGLSSTNMGSQPEEGEGGDEAGVKSHPGEGGGGDEAKALILNQYGVLGACSDSPKKAEAGCVVSQPEEGGGGDEAGADEAGELVLNQYGVSGKAEDKAGRAYPQSVWDSEAWELSLKKAGGLILNQDGISGAWSEAEKTAEAGTKPERLSSANMGCDVSQPEETGGGDEAGTTGSQSGEGGGGEEVRGLNLKNPEKAEVWKLKPKKTEVWKLAEEVTGKDEAGSVEAQAEEDTGVEAQDEEDRGKDEVWKHKLKKTEARRDLRSVQQDPAMLSEQSSGRYIVSDDVELPEDRAQYSDVNLLRQALLDAREFLRSGYTEIHFRGWRRDEPMKLLCARSAKQHEGTMELYLTYEDGGEEEGLLHPAGTGCTGPLLAFASRRQDGIPAPRRRLGRAHTIFFFKNDLVEWTAARGEAKRCKEGLVHHMRPRSSIMSQSGIQVLSLSGNNVGGGDTDESRRYSGSKARALWGSGYTVLSGEDGGGGDKEDGGGGDEAGALVLNQYGVSGKAEAGRGRSRSAYVSGAWSQAEEGEGGDEAGTDEAGVLVLNQYGVSGKAEAGTRSEVCGLNLRNASQGRGEGGDEAGALIVNQDGVSGGDEAGALILNQCEVRGVRRRGAAATLILNQNGGQGEEAQPPRLSSTRGGDQAGASILNQYGVPGAWSPLQEDRGGDEAGALNLNQYGVPGAWSPLEEDGGRDKDGGDKAEVLILNQYGVPSAWSPLQETKAGTRCVILNQYGSPVRGVNLKKTEVPGLNLKKTEAGTRPERISSTNMG
ncbi:unnamed protein product, partial [Symbiodinium sp. CCMP2592]